MKRVFFIIGILIITALAGVLLFLLFASDEQKKDIFNAFNIQDDPASDISFTDIVDSIIPNKPAKLAPLRQLSLKRVIGVNEVGTSASSTSDTIFYAEAGTGHVFSLNITTGEESRISNITVATAKEAHISSDGGYAAISTDSTGLGRTLVILSLPKGGRGLSSNELPEKVKEFALTSDNYVLYTTISGGTLMGRSYAIESKEIKTLFTLPFTEATVLFGKKSNDSLFVYPKTAESLEGYIYEVSSGVLNRLPISGFALNAAASAEHILYSLTKNGTYSSTLYNTADRTEINLSSGIIAEKCSFSEREFEAVCGVNTATKKNPVTDWYKGVAVSKDTIWSIDIFSGEMTLLANPLELVGRDIDITHPIINSGGLRLYFINKADGGLWVFDRSLTLEQ